MRDEREDWSELRDRFAFFISVMWEWKWIEQEKKSIAFTIDTLFGSHISSRWHHQLDDLHMKMSQVLFENENRNEKIVGKRAMMTASWEWDKWHFFGSWRAPGTVNNVNGWYGWKSLTDFDWITSEETCFSLTNQRVTTLRLCLSTSSRRIIFSPSMHVIAFESLRFKSFSFTEAVNSHPFFIPWLSVA